VYPLSLSSVTYSFVKAIGDSDLRDDSDSELETAATSFPAGLLLVVTRALPVVALENAADEL
jgi:hypothetical protein